MYYICTYIYIDYHTWRAAEPLLVHVRTSCQRRVFNSALNCKTFYANDFRSRRMAAFSSHTCAEWIGVCMCARMCASVWMVPRSLFAVRWSLGSCTNKRPRIEAIGWWPSNVRGVSKLTERSSFTQIALLWVEDGTGGNRLAGRGLGCKRVGGERMWSGEKARLTGAVVVHRVVA